MPDIRALVGKLNPPCRQALERAAARCMRLSQTAVEVEHLLLELVQQDGTDVAEAMAMFGLTREAVATDLDQAIARMRGGNQRTPALAESLVEVIADAWTLASVDLGLPQIRSALLLRAVFAREATRALLVASAPALALLPRDRLVAELPALLARSPEQQPHAAPARAAAGATPNLDAYTLDLTAEARAGRLDPILGRDAEIRQVIDILLRRRQNNPILTGEAGVGKTAVVEGFAQRVAAGSVPPPLRGIAVRSLDLGLLQAGAGMRGEFERRLRGVIDEVAGAPVPTVLFVDEAHVLLGAGDPGGQADAANLLKPALARGALRTIAATTWGEYKRHIEKDPALARRFQVVRVAEPSEAATVVMLRGLVPRLEAHHGVRIEEAALAAAARLSHRYITGRQLPDKAIGVLDTAAARVAVAQADEPAALQDLRARAAALSVEIARLEAEADLADVPRDGLESLRQEQDRLGEETERLAGRWALERDTVGRLRGLEQRLRGGEDTPALRADLAALRLELSTLQQEGALVPVAVDAEVVAGIVAAWTGVPVGAILGNTGAEARPLRERLGERVIGQEAALDAICRRIQTFQAGLGEPGKPTGVFLLCGPSGVGKTETALTLAELLFGGPQALITVNMSEYQEAHSVSGLKGAPPGYVGYGRGGVLTEAVRRRPYSVLLLDEIEKAHPDVVELFYQVFDRGMLEDSEGQLVDFSNTVILATSNLGAERLEAAPDLDGDALRPLLLRHFPAAFLGRLVVVAYQPLGTEEIEAIARLKLGRLRGRFTATHGGDLTWDEALVAAIAARAGTTESGARTVDAILTHSILPLLSERILDRIAGQGTLSADAHLGLSPEGGFTVTLWP
ncbi:MAG: type VI secretion system ATPase TssH [Paracraurococcus sp.]